MSDMYEVIKELLKRTRALNDTLSLINGKDGDEGWPLIKLEVDDDELVVRIYMFTE